MSAFLSVSNFYDLINAEPGLAVQNAVAKLATGKPSAEAAVAICSSSCLELFQFSACGWIAAVMRITFDRERDQTTL